MWYLNIRTQRWHYSDYTNGLRRVYCGMFFSEGDLMSEYPPTNISFTCSKCLRKFKSIYSITDFTTYIIHGMAEHRVVSKESMSGSESRQFLSKVPSIKILWVQPSGAAMWHAVVADGGVSVCGFIIVQDGLVSEWPDSHGEICSFCRKSSILSDDYIALLGKRLRGESDYRAVRF